ncbi:prephenate dehydratase [Archaeoglobus veneficus]|uniref:Prephenate dehydrogenase n=1 Tax=Archaeoglobus veneficus (strain DSM 11195 / SNP6) TaxID=693661 RepID=F2KPV8_ARCVS|nr:prephenate dehydratase [Archaeoglobus veneficus]AEA46465.1 prephenate dehydratase [Archaeoglobus veneficus SNP6]
MKPGILIYGMGRMGKFFYDFFFSRGYDVAGYDVVPERRTIEEDKIESYDVIFLCVPMQAVGDAIARIPRSSALIVDISSIKGFVLPYLDASGFDYLSIHPMFGPDSEIGLSNIIVVKKSGRKEEEVILEEFRKAGAVLSELPPEKHDAKMAEIQGLAHFLLVGMAHFLAERFDREDLKYASPIFATLYKLSSRILNQDWRMYYYIQKNAEILRREFIKSLADLDAKFSDEEKFRKLFEELGSKFDDYGNSTLILDACKATWDVSTIELLRGYIRAVDSLILRLLERRTQAGRKIALHKRDRNEPIEIADLEEVKIKDLLLRTSLNPIYVQDIFENIMGLTKEEEYRVLGIKKTLAVLGPAGSFSEEAALKLVGSRLPLKYCATTDEIIKCVENGSADYGLVPIENSVNGTVISVLDALLNHDVEVFGETTLEIVHCLAARRYMPLKEIRVVYSHPQAIAQCMGFINNYLKAELRYTSSTSDAIALLDDYSAAIVSENAAKLHKLYVLRKGIQDAKANTTRFYLIRKKGSGEMRGSITSLFFGVEDRPGALKDVLEVFYRKGINMRKLESRPARTGLGDYVFFVEVEKDLSSEDLRELRNVTTFYHIVGVFDRVERLDLWG